MRLIAFQKKNAIGYFVDDQVLRMISFPFTPATIKIASEIEVEYALNLYGYDPCAKDFRTINELVSFLKEQQLAALEESDLNLDDIDLDDIVEFADEAMMNLLCDSIEQAGAGHDHNRSLKVLELIKENAREKKLPGIYDRAQRLINNLFVLQAGMNQNVEALSLPTDEATSGLHHALINLWQGNDVMENLQVVVGTHHWKTCLFLLFAQINMSKRNEDLPEWIFELLDTYENRHKKEFHKYCKNCRVVVEILASKISIDGREYHINVQSDSILERFSENMYA
jgi:hypothetical protein